MANIQTLNKIGIIGRGAIGINMAAHLQSQRGIETTLLVRDTCNVTETISLKTNSGVTHNITCPQVHISADAIRNLDLIVMPVKQYQIETLLQSIAPHLRPHTTLVLLHNGMGGVELAQKYAPNNYLLAATTTDGVYKTSHTEFVQTAIGRVDIGAIEENMPAQITPNNLFELVNKLHSNLHWRNDIVFSLFQKLAINAVINPLTALKNCKNGELENYKNDVDAIKNEVFDLYEFMNLPIDTHQLSQQIDDVIKLTKHNYSSMHQDFQHGRKTEIEGILGFLLSKAAETGMKMYTIESLYKQIASAQTQ